MCEFMHGHLTDQDTVDKFRDELSQKNPAQIEIVLYTKDGILRCSCMLHLFCRVVACILQCTCMHDRRFFSFTVEKILTLKSVYNFRHWIIFHYTRCITPTRVTSRQGPSPYHCACGQYSVFRINVAAVASRWQHWVQFGRSEVWTSDLPPQRRTRLPTGRGHLIMQLKPKSLHFSNIKFHLFSLCNIMFKK